MALSKQRENREKQLANLRPCKPGETRNPGGRPKSKRWLAEIEKWMDTHPEDITEAIKKTFKKAKTGSLPHLRELIDRTDGPVQQSVDIQGLSSLVDILLERENEAD